MHAPCKGQFLGMEVIPTGPVDDLTRLVSQHNLDAIGGVTDGGVVREVCSAGVSLDHGIFCMRPDMVGVRGHGSGDLPWIVMKVVSMLQRSGNPHCPTP